MSIPINKMKVYKNVVVELNHTDIKFPETVPCYANFDYSNPIGVARLYYVPVKSQNIGNLTVSAIAADICLFEDKWNGAWPVTGVSRNEKDELIIVSLGICSTINYFVSDFNIEPLHDVIVSGVLNEVSLTSDGYGVGMSNVKIQDHNPINSFERIIPEGTPLIWGNMGLTPDIFAPANIYRHEHIDFSALGQWPQPNHSVDEKPIGKVINISEPDNSKGRQIEVTIGFNDDNPIHHSDTRHHPKQHTLNCGRCICMDCGVELFAGRTKE